MEEPTVRCPLCGLENPPKREFCQRCGKYFSNIIPEATAEQPISVSRDDGYSGLVEDVYALTPNENVSFGDFYLTPSYGVYIPLAVPKFDWYKPEHDPVIATLIGGPIAGFYRPEHDPVLATLIGGPIAGLEASMRKQLKPEEYHAAKRVRKDDFGSSMYYRVNKHGARIFPWNDIQEIIIHEKEQRIIVRLRNCVLYKRNPDSLIFLKRDYDKLSSWKSQTLKAPAPIVRDFPSMKECIGMLKSPSPDLSTLEMAFSTQTGSQYADIIYLNLVVEHTLKLNEHDWEVCRTNLRALGKDKSQKLVNTYTSMANEKTKRVFNWGIFTIVLLAIDILFLRWARSIDLGPFFILFFALPAVLTLIGIGSLFSAVSHLPDAIKIKRMLSQISNTW